MPPPPSPPNPPPPTGPAEWCTRGLLDYCAMAMRNYISLALVTTPSGLGSHCKHVGAPARLRIGSWLRGECSAGAGDEGARTTLTGAESKGMRTILQCTCACKNAKPNFFQSVEKRPRERTGCIARLWKRSRRMQWTNPRFERSSGSRDMAQCRRAGLS